MVFLDAETRARRRAMLREHYLREEEMFERELAARGLAFARERL